MAVSGRAPYIDRFHQRVCIKCGADTEPAVLPRGEFMGHPAQWCPRCQHYQSEHTRILPSPLPCRYCERSVTADGEGMVHHSCETIAFHLPVDDWDAWMRD
jgi:hypothetical protein